MRIHTARKQTQYLRSLHSFSRSSANSILAKNHNPMRTSGILFVSLASVAGVSSLAFAMQYHGKPAHQALTPTVHAEVNPLHPAQQSTADTSVTIDSSQASVSNGAATTTDTTASPTVSGQATINNEVIPLTEGTVQRSFTDSSGTEHTVTISLDGQSTTVQSDTTNSSIDIHTSSTSTGTNTTRGSPIR